uniref:Uncharacterized protein n=1 Tax=Anopheles darlingi TaxID=43151 RepID=A0A2M4D8H0_ANODA
MLGWFFLLSALSLWCHRILWGPSFSLFCLSPVFGVVLCWMCNVRVGARGIIRALYDCEVELSDGTHLHAMLTYQGQPYAHRQCYTDALLFEIFSSIGKCFYSGLLLQLTEQSVV